MKNALEAHKNREIVRERPEKGGFAHDFGFFVLDSGLFHREPVDHSVVIGLPGA